MTATAARHQRMFPGAGESVATVAVARWLIGLRVVAVTAVLVGALAVQSVSEEILAIAPLAQVVTLTYALTLVWIAMLLLGMPPALNTGFQLAGDLVILTFVIHITGDVFSPFPFLYLVPVSVAAVLFGLRGALSVAGAAFALYGGMAVAVINKLLPGNIHGFTAPSQPSGVILQLSATGLGFALVAFLTSYLAHSRQQAVLHLVGQREATERLRALSADVVRAVGSGVLATDADGSVVLANPAAERILGLSGGGQGGPISEALPLDGLDWNEVWARLKAHPVRLQRLEAVHIPTGTPLGLAVAPLGAAGGGFLGLVVHFQDLTEAREEARRERLRERMVAVGEMSSGIAHEIRNPMASISGAAQVLAKVSQLPDTEQRLLRIIVQESQRLSGIIEAYLNYARPPEPQRGPCDIAATLESTLELFAHSTEVGENHTVRTEIQAHAHPVVADEAQLRQAFFNLACNAVQAMPQGGTLEVIARPEGQRYVITWRDEGIGMSPAQLEEIFQPFKSFRTGGTGLGLAVVYSIVSDHGGEIHVDSVPGRGTIFTVTLPLEAS